MRGMRTTFRVLGAKERNHAAEGTHQPLCRVASRQAERDAPWLRWRGLACADSAVSGILNGAILNGITFLVPYVVVHCWNKETQLTFVCWCYTGNFAEFVY